MQNAVKQIIKGIKSGCVFDSHFVISEIIRLKSDEYIHFASPKEKTRHMHHRIAGMISGLPPALVARLDEKSWSNNIHGKANECTLWKRK